MIYLDYNATTPIATAVRNAMQPFLDTHFGNPSSGHALGRLTAQAIETARSELASLLNCQANEIVFTGGGTESNNMAIQGAMFRHAPLPNMAVGGGHLVISAIEHPATSQVATFLESLGNEVTRVGCNNQGVIDPADIEAALRENTVLVSVMHANNEVGALQPIAEIAKICRERGVLCHTDAAQSIGKVPVDIEELGVDLLTLAGHKIYAPKGIGALYVREGVELEPVLHGAGHEQGRRPGTENVPYIVGLGKAATLLTEDLETAAERMRNLRDFLETRLVREIHPSPTVNAGEAERLPNTLSINFPRVNGAELLAKCEDLCASTGAACHSGISSLSATLRAMQLDEQTAQGTVRLSVGRGTSEDDVQRAASMLIEAWQSLQ